MSKVSKHLKAGFCSSWPVCQVNLAH